MTLYHYIDPANGDDLNSGEDWANATKTIKYGSIGVSDPDDAINRIAKSPDPTSIGSATWTDQSKTVTLAGALTANVDLCEAAWTASANITATADSSTAKQGTYSAKLVVAAAFTTGKVSYHALGSAIDFSSYQQLSFWFVSTVYRAAGALKICLCSDTTGDTIVDEFVLPEIETTQLSKFKCYTLNKGSALGSAIQSVALYAITDPGTATFWIDNILAVKAASTANALSLTSLISKNSLATGGNEGWYPIQSIDGTTVKLDNAPNTTAASGEGYYGTTETVTTYRREAFRCISTACAIPSSGTADLILQFQGGYNTSTGNQDGETFFDVGSGAGSGIDLTGRSNVMVNRVNMVRSSSGITLSGSGVTNCQITAHTLAGNASYGAYLYQCGLNTLNIKNIINNGSTGIRMDGTASGCSGNKVTAVNINNNLGGGISLATNASFNTISASNVCNNTGIGELFNNASDNTVKATNTKYNSTYAISFMINSMRNTVETETAGNATAAVQTDTICRNFLRKCTLNEATKVTGFANFSNGQVLSTAEGSSTDNNFIYTDGGLIKSQTTVRHTASGIAWQLMPTSVNRKEGYPLVLSLAKIAVAANAEVTVTARFQKDNAGITGKLFCRAGQLPGMTADAVATKNSTLNAFEQLSISFTPTEAGVVEVEALAYGGTTYCVYVDDIDYSQA